MEDLNKYNFDIGHQSPWLIDIYNQYIPFKTNGMLVEIGVGHTIRGIDKVLPGNLTEFTRCGSNTGGLLDIGWSGIYIEPVKEYCEEARIAHHKNLSRLQIINMGASNTEDELTLYLGDSFVPNDFGDRGYSWIGRKVKTDKTSHILEACNCPKEIDIMSIDVEGFEVQVIEGIDFAKHTPSLIIAEIGGTPKEKITKALPDYYSFITDDGLNGVWFKKHE